MFGGIETGGTKTVCAVGADGAVEHRAQFPTGEDADALADRCAEFFAAHPVRSIGVGTFGPCDPDPGSATYGHILNTPKPGWSGVDLLGKLAARVDAPMVLTTDVTAAAIGEQRYGAGRGNQNLVYLTIGTGVGGGAIVDGRVLHGRTHPEMGHILMPDIATGGVCPYHGDCFEGLASGPAMAARRADPHKRSRTTTPPGTSRPGSSLRVCTPSPAHSARGASSWVAVSAAARRCTPCSRNHSAAHWPATCLHHCWRHRDWVPTPA